MTAKASPYQIAKNGHIATRLRQEMIKREWSYETLAREVGNVTSAAVSHWMNSINAPSEAMQKKLSKLLGIPKEDLMPRDVEGAVSRGRPMKPLLTTKSGEAFSLTANQDGTCRLKLDLILTIEDGAKLFNHLTSSGLMPKGEPDESAEPDKPPALLRQLQ